MRREGYTDRQIEFLRLACPHFPIPDLAVVFNRISRQRRTEGAIKSALTNHGIRSGRPRGVKGRLRNWTQEQAAFLREGYRVMTEARLTEAFNAHFGECRTRDQVACFLNNHHVRSGRDGRFPLGHTPWNMGTAAMGLMKPNSGTFRKGNVPRNTREIGAQRIDSKDGYLHVKVAEPNPYTGCPTRFRPAHVLLWEAAHGPVPPSHAVIFRDGDRTRIEIDNLMMVTRAELARINQLGYRTQPDELKPTVLALARLANRAGELRRRQAERSDADVREEAV